MVDLSKRKLLIIDNGLFSFIAEHCAKYYGEVIYNRPTAAVFLEGGQHMIGYGLPGVKWVDDYEPWPDRVDEIFFTDVNHASKAALLRSRGYPVAGGSELMEQDKRYCYKKFHDVGLPVSTTKYFKGIEAAWNFLKNFNGGWWVKPATKYRGDLNTFEHISPQMTKIVFNVLRAKIGIEQCEDIGILVQRSIPDAVEIGEDGIRFDENLYGRVIGLEAKGDGNLCRIAPYAPPIMANFEQRIGPIYRDLQYPEEYRDRLQDMRMGYRGPYSSEMRVRRDGIGFPIDETNRPANPPTASILKLYGEDYPRAICDVAHGREPVITPQFTHAGELVIRSTWHMKWEIYMSIPAHLREWVMLKNQMRRGQDSICVENSCGGAVASVVAVGNSIEEVGELIEERAEQLKVFQMERMPNFLDVMRPKIEKAKEYAGIDLEKGYQPDALAA